MRWARAWRRCWRSGGPARTPPGPTCWPGCWTPRRSSTPSTWRRGCCCSRSATGTWRRCRRPPSPGSGSCSAGSEEAAWKRRCRKPPSSWRTPESIKPGFSRKSPRGEPHLQDCVGLLQFRLPSNLEHSS